MKTIKKILVPTDFSSVADNALMSALFLADTLKAEIELVHFYHHLVPTDAIGQPIAVSPTWDYEAEENVAKERLGQIKHQVNIRFPQIKVSTRVQLGFLGDTLPMVSHFEAIDLIVCGTNGTDKFGELLLGTNTTSVVQHSAIPVLVVPGNATLNKLNTIVFATDFQFDDVKVLTELAFILNDLGSLIQVVHLAPRIPANADTLDWLQEMAEARTEYPFITYYNIEKEASSENLNNFLKEQRADLVVMTTKGKGLFERLTKGSLTRGMICHSTTPVLVYHIQDHKIAES